MGNASGQMGKSQRFATKKISGFSSGFANKKSNINGSGFSSKTQGNYSIKSPRQAKGSKGDGMNGGY